MCKNTKKSLVALIALAATLALMACVPTVDPKELTGDEDISYPNYVIVKLAKNDVARSLNDTEAADVVNFYELIVIPLDGNPNSKNNLGKASGTGPSGALQPKDILTDRKPRGQGSLVVPVEIGKFYGVMFLEGWRSSDGKKYVLLKSAYSSTRLGDPSASPAIPDGEPIKAGENMYKMTSYAIQVGPHTKAQVLPNQLHPLFFDGSYYFEYKSKNNSVTNITGSPGVTRLHSYRVEDGQRILPVRMDLPLSGVDPTLPTLTATDSVAALMDDWSSTNNAPKLKIKVEGVSPLVHGWVVSQGTSPTSGPGLSPGTTWSPAAAIPLKSIFSDITGTAGNLSGPTFGINAHVTDSGFVINRTFASVLNGTPNNPHSATNTGAIPASATAAVKYRDDYGYATGAAAYGTNFLSYGQPADVQLARAKVTLEWQLSPLQFPTRKGDGYLYFKAPYRAFSLDGNPGGLADLANLTKWTIQNGLDNDLDYESHTGGSVLVKFGGGGGGDGEKGTVIIVEKE